MEYVVTKYINLTHELAWIHIYTGMYHENICQGTTRDYYM